MTNFKTAAIGSGECADDAVLSDSFIEEVRALAMAGGQDGERLKYYLYNDPIYIHTYIMFSGVWLDGDASVQDEMKRLLDLYVDFFTQMRGMTPSHAIVDGVRW